jgi:hypothetical protein
MVFLSDAMPWRRGEVIAEGQEQQTQTFALAALALAGGDESIRVAELTGDVGNRLGIRMVNNG